MARIGNTPFVPPLEPPAAPSSPPAPAAAAAPAPSKEDDEEEVSDAQALYETLVEALKVTPFPVRMKLADALNNGTPFEQLSPKVRAVLAGTAQALFAEDEDEDEDGEDEETHE